MARRRRRMAKSFYRGYSEPYNRPRYRMSNWKFYPLMIILLSPMWLPVAFLLILMFAY